MFKRNFEDHLLWWKNQSNRKPLIVRGARQVGKTSTTLAFGKKHFDNVVYINLDNPLHFQMFNTRMTVSDLILTINTGLSSQVIEGKTLLFIDEIQNSEAMLEALRFLYEEKPDIHVIAAGSLLEAKIAQEGFSMPVGRVEYGYMFPMTYFEYLDAANQHELLSFLKEVNIGQQIPSSVHDLALNQFYKYAMLGGMPEVLKVYLTTQSLEDSRHVLNSLLTSYSEDVFKYSSQANSKYLNYIITNGPKFAGSVFSYENFAGSDYRSREMSMAFDLLEKAMLLTQVRATSSNKLPIVAKEKRPKKLVWLDVGFVNFIANVYNEYINSRDLNDVYRGRISEQIIGQTLLSMDSKKETGIYYWSKEKTQGTAELDYCLQHNGLLVGIEVKSGVSTKLRSLISFADAVKKTALVKISPSTLHVEKITFKNKVYTVNVIPFYLCERIFELI